VAVAARVTPRGARRAARVAARVARRHGARRVTRRIARRGAARGAAAATMPPARLGVESRHDCGHAGDRTNQSNEDLGSHRRNPSRESRDAGGRPHAGRPPPEGPKQ
jgi:hypothetical protein